MISPSSPKIQMTNNPLNDFISWLTSLPEDGYASAVSSRLLYHCPNYNYEPKGKIDSTKVLVDHLRQLTGRSQILGMCLYIENAVSFYVREYGNVDKFLDSVNDNNELMADAADNPDVIDALKGMNAREHAALDERKELKESWDNFKDEFFNHDAFAAYSF